MNDDFNTPIAMAVLFDLAGEVNRTGSAQMRAPAQGAGRYAGPARARSAYLPAGRQAWPTAPPPSTSRHRIAARKAAKAARNSPRQTASVPNCSRRAWCWRTSRGGATEWKACLSAAAAQADGREGPAAKWPARWRPSRPSCVRQGRRFSALPEAKAVPLPVETVVDAVRPAIGTRPAPT